MKKKENKNPGKTGISNSFIHVQNHNLICVCFVLFCFVGELSDSNIFNLIDHEKERFLGACVRACVMRVRTNF